MDLESQIAISASNGEHCAEVVLRDLLTTLQDVGLTAPQGPSDADRQLQCFEAFKSRIDNAFKAKAAELRRNRNLLVPIHQLPSELLVHILLFSLKRHEWNLDSLQNMAGVCRWWFELVTTSPLFWAEATSKDTDALLALVLELNDAAPLRICCVQANNDRTERFLRMVAPSSHRWESLTILTELPHSLVKHLDVPTPMLVDLFISITGSDEGRHIPLQDSGGKHLRDVDIERAYLPWDSCRLTRLRSLSIRGPAQRLPSIDQLHTILWSSPEIWYIVLSSWNVPEDSKELQPAGPKEPIHLPKLSTLVLVNIPSPLTDFLLSHLICPNCSAIEADDIYITSSTAIHLSQLLAPAVSQATQLCIRVNTSPEQVFLHTEPVPEFENTWTYLVDETIGADLTFRRDSFLNCWEEFGHLLHNLPHIPVRLKIEAESSPESGDFPLGFLRYLSEVTSVHFDGCRDPGLVLQCLTRPSEEDGSWLCPKLVELEIGYLPAEVPVQEIIAFANRGNACADDPSHGAPPARFERVKAPERVLKALKMAGAGQSIEYVVV